MVSKSRSNRLVPRGCGVMVMAVLAAGVLIPPALAQNSCVDLGMSDPCHFPTVLSQNTTGQPDSKYLGAPDDIAWGLGGQIVTYQFTCTTVVDGPGPDFNVYELETEPTVEFNLIDVLVSRDGGNFVSVKSTEGPGLVIPGDEMHSNIAFARSYDLSGSGLSSIQYIRIDGNGTGASGQFTGFELDAVGAANIRLTFLDCNGNGTVDAADIAAHVSLDANSNGIPDECDFQFCDLVWGGFNAYAINTKVTDIDYLNDGFYWLAPMGTNGYIASSGCQPGTVPDRAVEVKVNTSLGQGTEQEGYVASEYFHTVDGQLDCGAAIYSLTFSFKIPAGINSKWDWEYFIYDARSGGRVVQLEFPSTVSSLVPADQKGKILVKNPAGDYTSTGVAFAVNTCYQIRVVLNNLDDTLKVYVADLVTPKVATTRLDAYAHRMDYFHVQPKYNGASNAVLTWFKLDKFKYCITGPSLMDWADCNGNCVDDLWDIANLTVEDCNFNGVPDPCDQTLYCGCGEYPYDACMACNQIWHHWDFEPTSTNGFALGDINCQEGWAYGPTTEANTGQIVASGAPFAGQPGFYGQALKINTKSSPGIRSNGVRGPRTHDEQPGKPATTDPGMEYWEFDVVMDADDPNGSVLLVVWDECANSFTALSTALPGCYTADPPTCFLMEQTDVPYGQNASVGTYAYFNAGVRFRFRAQQQDEVINILKNGAWSTSVNGNAPGLWDINVAKHISIRIDNELGEIHYYAAVHTPGQLDISQIDTGVAPLENPNGKGDRQVLLVTTSAMANAYVDNLKYTVDDNCDHDIYPDAYYLPGGAGPGSAAYDTNSDQILDWCQDCNRNCRLDSVDIAGGTSRDCNLNGNPDECDINPSYPVYGQTRDCTGQPWSEPSGGWSHYTRHGGGSLDSNSNGTPDDCEPALDCNGNKMLDACELSCTPGPVCKIPPTGCGLGPDLGGPAGCTPDGILDDCQADCNGNRIHDRCDIAAGTSLDVGLNGIPDECEVDCDGNGTPDAYEIILVPDRDCYPGTPDGILDLCQVHPDCNTNGLTDACDILHGTSRDCQPNGIPDSCDLESGASQDCQPNGIPDSCDIAAGTSLDCQPNGIPDSCDIAGGTSLDANADGTPDECISSAHCQSASPVDQGSLWRSANNTIKITFDGNITAPAAGQVLIQKMLDSGLYDPADLSSSFTFTVENDPNQGNEPRILKIRENGTVLTHRTWYAIHNTGGWTAASPFEVEYVLQIGDANADGKVLANDLSAIFPKIPTNPAGDQERADINGDAKVLANDLSVVFPRIPSNTVTKPTGHTSSCGP